MDRVSKKELLPSSHEITSLAEEWRETRELLSEAGDDSRKLTLLARKLRPTQIALVSVLKDDFATLQNTLARNEEQYSAAAKSGNPGGKKRTEATAYSDFISLRDKKRGQENSLRERIVILVRAIQALE